MVQFLRPESIFGITPRHFTGRNLMKRTVFGAIVVAVASLSLSGCFEAEAEQKPKEQKEVSDKFWEISTPDRSQDKGFKP